MSAAIDKAIEVAREIEASATEGPWVPFDNFVESEHADGAKGKIIAEFFAYNPMYGDNSYDTRMVAYSRNNLPKFVDALEIAVKFIRNETCICDHSHQYTCECCEALADIERALGGKNE